MKFKVYRLAVAVVIRKKGRVIQRAMIRFKNGEHYAKFCRILSKTKLEYHTVHIREAHDPEGEGKPGTLWCPYCADWRNFFKEDDYLKCEICLVSTDDFYTQRYNPEALSSKRSSRRRTRNSDNN